MNSIEVDPRVPGIRDEIPFPLLQAKQCSPEQDFPSWQLSSPFGQNLQRSQEKPIVAMSFKHHAADGIIAANYTVLSVQFIKHLRHHKQSDGHTYARF